MELQYAFKFIDTYNQDFKDLNCISDIVEGLRN